MSGITIQGWWTLKWMGNLKPENWKSGWYRKIFRWTVRKNFSKNWREEKIAISKLPFKAPWKTRFASNYQRWPCIIDWRSQPVRYRGTKWTQRKTTWNRERKARCFPSVAEDRSYKGYGNTVERCQWENK